MTGSLEARRLYRILICEDEENIVSFLKAELLYDGFQADADDYVTKPFDTLELIARIKRNIARTKQDAAKQAGLKLDSEDCRAFIDGNQLSLTKTEFEILRFLYENKNKVKTRDEIIGAVFGDFYGESNVVDVNMKNIRAKILPHTAEEIISTVRGKGYVIRR